MTGDRRRADELRGRTLLQLGSGSAGGDELPSAGFESRLRARIAANGRAPSPPTWSDALGTLARPAVAMAAIVMGATLALQLWDRSRGDALALLAQEDAALAAALDESLDDAFVEDAP